MDIQKTAMAALMTCIMATPAISQPGGKGEENRSQGPKASYVVSVGPTFYSAKHDSAQELGEGVQLDVSMDAGVFGIYFGGSFNYLKKDAIPSDQITAVKPRQILRAGTLFVGPEMAVKLSDETPLELRIGIGIAGMFGKQHREAGFNLKGDVCYGKVCVGYRNTVFDRHGFSFTLTVGYRDDWSLSR